MIETDLSKFLKMLAKGKNDFKKETLRFPHLGSSSNEIKVTIEGISFNFDNKEEFISAHKNLNN